MIRYFKGHEKTILMGIENPFKYQEYAEILMGKLTFPIWNLRGIITATH